MPWPSSARAICSSSCWNIQDPGEPDFYLDSFERVRARQGAKHLCVLEHGIHEGQIAVEVRRPAAGKFIFPSLPKRRVLDHRFTSPESPPWSRFPGEAQAGSQPEPAWPRIGRYFTLANRFSTSAQFTTF